MFGKTRKPHCRPGCVSNWSTLSHLIYSELQYNWRILSKYGPVDVPGLGGVMRVMVLGASGMLGSTVLRVLSEKGDWEAFGMVRDESVKRFFSASIGVRKAGIDVEN